MIAGTFHTLQDFLLHTEGVTYLLIAGFLVLFVWFYRTLVKNDDRGE